MKMAPILYYCAASCPSRSAVLAAHAVGVNVTLKNVNLIANEHLEPEFIKINPQHTLPVLKDDEFIVTDSHVIGSYLVNKYAKDDTLYPKDPNKKGIIDQRLYFDAEILFPKIRGICYPILFLGKTTVDVDLKRGVYESLSLFEKLLEGKTWVAGDNMTIADCACVASVSSLEALGFDVSKYSNVAAWLSQCKELMPGYMDLNDAGAKQLGEVIHSRIEPNQI